MDVQQAGADVLFLCRRERHLVRDGPGMIGQLKLRIVHAIELPQHLHEICLAAQQMSGRDTRVLMKLIVDGTSDRVLGCHIVGDSAAEIVQAVAIAMKMKATKADFDATMALHPTAAEELVTMRTPTARHVREAAE